MRPQGCGLHLDAQPIHARIDLHSSRIEHRAQRAAATAVRRCRGPGAFGRQNDQRAVVVRQPVPVALPLLQPAERFGNVFSRGFLALRAHLLGRCELGRQIAVLPILPIQLQRNGDADRHHVGVRRAALAEHQLDAPVRAPVATRDVDIGARHLFLLHHQRDLRVQRQLTLERCLVEAYCGHRGWRAQRLFRVRTDPPREPGRGRGNLPLGLADAVLDQRDGGTRSEHLRLRTAPAAIGRIRRFDLQAGLDALCLQQVEHALLVVTVEPGLRGVAA